MATLDEAIALVTSLPEAVEGIRYGYQNWTVQGKGFAWVRPFSKADIKRFGNEIPPDGPILAVSTEDLGDKEAILAAGTPGIFTIEHFNNYPAVLIQLNAITTDALREAITDAWLACAPPDLAEQFLSDGHA
jgi:hypothetical protein